MDLETWYMGIVVVAAVGQTLFTLLYATFPWYRTFLGRALFIKAVSLMFTLDVVFARVILEVPRGEALVVMALGFTAFGIWAQLVAFSIHRYGGGDQESTDKKKSYHHGT